jgi:hypothetical protein
MSARRDHAFFAICLALQGCVIVALALAARSGCQPSTVVIGLAACFIPYLGVIAFSRSVGSPRALNLIAVLSALTFGGALLFAPPLLSDDLYRYLWEGRLWLEGVNPYRLSPDDLTLAPLRDDLWSKVNNKSLGSIYPPLSQLWFVAAAWLGGTVWTVKLLALLAHVFSVAVLARVSTSSKAPLALALNPLLLSEGALNGHFDILCGLALLVAAWALAQGRFGRAGIAASAAVGLKAVGLVIVPLFVRRPKALLGTGLVSALLLVPLVVSRGPVDPASGPGQFASRWRGNESLFALVDWLSVQISPDGSADLVARSIVVLALLLLCALVVYRQVPPLSAARVLVWGVLFLSPQVHPWYLAWLLPLELAAGGSAGLVWTAAVLCAYAPLDLWVAQEIWRMPLRLQIFEYSVVVLALIVDPRRPTLRRSGSQGQFLL